ncbi:MAG: AAA family ATPase, partial [Alphaproteobacteria bacterium]|nr:AAA family ATPase [Alphaproteobacteria bacterium]
MYETVNNGSNSPRARCIVVGNEKGGSGKSTTVINLIFGLIDSGQSVICVD